MSRRLSTVFFLLIVFFLLGGTPHPLFASTIASQSDSSQTMFIANTGFSDAFQSVGFTVSRKTYIGDLSFYASRTGGGDIEFKITDGVSASVTSCDVSSGLSNYVVSSPLVSTSPQLYDVLPSQSDCYLQVGHTYYVSMLQDNGGAGQVSYTKGDGTHAYFVLNESSGDYTHIISFYPSKVVASSSAPLYTISYGMSIYNNIPVDLPISVSQICVEFDNQEYGASQNGFSTTTCPFQLSSNGVENFSATIELPYGYTSANWYFADDNALPALYYTTPSFYQGLSTTTYFIVDHTSSTTIASIYNLNTDSSGTTTTGGICSPDSNLNYCSPFGGAFSVGQCLQGLVYPDRCTMTADLNLLYSAYQNRVPFGYVNLFLNDIENTPSSSLPVFHAVIPVGIPGTGAAITLDPNHSLDWILYATSTNFGNSATTTIFALTSPLWADFVYLLLVLYIIRRLLGTDLIPLNPFGKGYEEGAELYGDIIKAKGRADKKKYYDEVNKIAGNSRRKIKRIDFE